jgi:Flagellar hook-length control protein FliK
MGYWPVCRFGNQTALTSSAKPMPAIDTASLLPSFSGELSLWDGLFSAGAAASNPAVLEVEQQFATLFAAAVGESAPVAAPIDEPLEVGVAVAFSGSRPLPGRSSVDGANVETDEVAFAGTEPFVLPWALWGPLPEPLPSAVSLPTAPEPAAELPVVRSNVAQAYDIPVFPETVWRTDASTQAFAINLVPVEPGMLRQNQVQEQAGKEHAALDGGPGDAVAGALPQVPLVSSAPESAGNVAVPQQSTLAVAAPLPQIRSAGPVPQIDVPLVLPTSPLSPSGSTQVKVVYSAGNPRPIFAGSQRNVDAAAVPSIESERQVAVELADEVPQREGESAAQGTETFERQQPELSDTKSSFRHDSDRPPQNEAERKQNEAERNTIDSTPAVADPVRVDGSGQFAPTLGGPQGQSGPDARAELKLQPTHEAPIHGAQHIQELRQAATRHTPVSNLVLDLDVASQTPVRLRISQSGGPVRMELHSPASEVRAVLNSDVGQLVSRLENAGYQVGSAELPSVVRSSGATDLSAGELAFLPPGAPAGAGADNSGSPSADTRGEAREGGRGTARDRRRPGSQQNFRR